VEIILKEFGRKRSLPDFKALSRQSHGGTEENHKDYQSDLLGENTNVVKRKAETMLDGGLEANSDKTSMCLLMSRYQIARHRRNIQGAEEIFQKFGKVEIFGSGGNRPKLHSRKKLISENLSYHAIQKFLSVRLRSKTSISKHTKLQFLFVVLYGCET
jgi:hypothetical protein